MIVQNIRDRLTAALGPDVPVLLPEQQREPLEAAPIDAQGRPAVGKGERGLGAYLAQHPQGYVQIETPQPLTSDTLIGVFWVAVAALHSTAEGAVALAKTVRLALNGTSVEPGRYREVTPAQPQPLQVDRAWMVRPTYEALTLDGEPAD